MQIVKSEVIPVELNLRRQARVGHQAEIDQITAVFVRLVTQKGQSAWGCAVAQPEMTSAVALVARSVRSLDFIVSVELWIDR